MADHAQQDDKPKLLSNESTAYVSSSNDYVPAANPTVISADELAALRRDDDADIGRDGPKKLTFNELLDTLGVGWYQILLLQVSGMGWMVDGIFLSMISFVVPFIQQFWNLSPIQAGGLGAIIFFGMMIGALFGGVLSDRYGRRMVMIVGMVIAALGTLASAFAPLYIFLLFFRFLVGLGLGAIVPTDFSYLLEFLPSKQRGLFLGLMNLYWSAGSISVCLLAWATMPNWRMLTLITLIPAVISLILRFFIDDSPRYLAVTNQKKKLMHIVNRIAYWNGTKLPPFELHLADEKFLGEHHAPVSQQLSELLAPEMKITSLLLWGTWFLLSYGSWGFAFLLPIIFVKLHSVNVYLNSLLVLCVGMLGYVTVTLVVEKFSRRRLMSFTLVLGGCITLLLCISQNPIFVLILGMISNYVVTFPWEILYTYTSEVYPTSSRTTAMGVCSFFTRLGGTVTPLVGTALLSQAFFLPFLSYGIALVIGGILCAFLPYETVGKELTDHIGDRDFENKKEEIKADDLERDTKATTPLIDHQA